MDDSFLSRNAILRPARWGVFIFAALALLTLGLRTLWFESLSGRWEELRGEREQSLRRHIETRFQDHVQELLRASALVSADPELLEALSEQTPDGAVRAFASLERYRSHDDLTIDITDANGNILIWSGRNIASNQQWTVRSQPADTIMLLTRSDLRSYLSVGLPFPRGFFYAIVSRPLEVNYPISNRFVSSVSLSSELSAALGREVRLSFSGVPEQEEVISVPLRSFGGDTLAIALTAAPTAEAELLARRSALDVLLILFLAIAAFFMAVTGSIWVGERWKAWAGAALIAGMVWVLRYVWLYLGFPAGVIDLTVFDPVHFASTFGFGLTASAGETLLSCLALLLTVVLFALPSLRRWSSREAPRVDAPLLRWIAIPALLFALVVTLLLLTRGYHEALRSFVFDSTVHFHDPTTLFPEPIVVAMHVNIILLSLSSVILLAMTLTGIAVALRTLMGVSTLNWVTAAAILLLVVALTPTVESFFSHAKFSSYYPVYASIVGLLLVFVLFRAEIGKRSAGGFSLRSAAWLFLASFAVSFPALDEKLHQKDRDHLQLFADEILRPADAWLSFVLTDALRRLPTTVGSLPEEPVSAVVRRSDLAFSAWSQTLIGREGYNSTVVLYNSDGKEVSRFVVGMTSYEQTELLTAVFKGEEEVLQVLERRVPGGTIKYYGIWGAIRDDDGRLIGYGALMIAASRQALFRGEAPEPLRAITRERYESHFRELTVSEYRDGILITTNNDNLYRGVRLPTSVLEELRNPRQRMVWRDEQVEGKDYETLYVRDDSRPGVVAALMIERQDIRWHLFNLVKVLMVYLVVFGGVTIAWAVVKRRDRSEAMFGFRERLIVAFLALAVLPLAVIGYYNRQLATERLEESVTQRLREDLALVDQRMQQTILDEDDFAYGINDDFCETVATEFRVDFSVYRRGILHASSRPELYQAAILDPRLPGAAYANILLMGKSYYRGTERIGEVEYAVGYRPLVIGERTFGVIAVPALYRQREIDLELAKRNAYIVGAYAFVLLLMVVAGLVLAQRLSRPLRTLTKAVREVGKGNLAVEIAPSSTDEVGELMSSFNEMVKELKAGREQAARIEREQAWKEMAKQVAHEIKNPLTPMKLSMQHLRAAFRDNVSDLREIVERVTQTVIDQVDALSRIASEFSNFARMPERRFERVRVHDLLEETVSLFKEVEGVEFRTKFSDTVPVVIADRDELRRVFINVVRNSIQAMERGGLVAISTSIDDHLCVVTIVDNGPGIPEDLQERVFQPNFSTKTDGTGLGLAICRKIMEDLNGSIDLRSEMKKGTTVEIRIPIQTVEHG
jgi:two-component system nitrogen regulation sensor histidine kinase NtrY